MVMWSENIVGVLKPIWFLSKLFLMRPRSIDEKVKNKKLSLSEKILIYIYNIGAVCVTIYLTSTTSSYTLNTNFNMITQLGDWLFKISNNVSMMAGVFCGLLYQNKMTRLIYRLDKIDKTLKHSFKRKSYTNVKIFIFCELFFTISLWISFFINYVLLQRSATLVKRLKNWIFIYMSTKVAQVVIVEFCAYVFVLKHKIKIINESIKEIFRGQKQDNKSTSSDLYHEKNLSEIEKIYEEVMAACTEVQSIFSFPLLMKVTSQFVGIFSSLYFCVFGYVSDDEIIKPQSFNDILTPLVTIFINIVELLVTVTVCELVVLEYKATRKLLFKIPIKKNDFALMRRINLFSLQLIHTNFEFNASGFFKINGSLIQTINIFSLQLLHKNFDFTASGLFKINCSLLQTILGAVTVYLVMFIQFDIATNKAQP